MRYKDKRSNDDFQLSKCILRHQFLTNSLNIFYYCKQCSCWWFQKLLITTWYIYPAQSPETLSASKPSCWFIFAGMWLFVYNYVSTDSWDGFAKKKLLKKIFLTRQWSIEIVPEISLPPCIWLTRTVRGVSGITRKKAVDCFKNDLSSENFLFPVLSY